MKRLVDSLQWRGFDFVKVLSFLPREVFLAILAEAKQRGIQVAGHVPFGVSVDEASAAGLHSVEHLTGIALACSTAEDSIRAELVRAAATVDTGFIAHMRVFDHSEIIPVATIDERKCARLLARLAERQTWQVPTLVVLHTAARITDPAFRHDRRLQYVSPAVRQFWSAAAEDARGGVGLVPEETWQWYLTAVRWMRRAGVPLLAGTDVQNPYVFPGFSLHEELALLVEAGLTPAEALRTTTLNPAIFLEATDSLGTVDVGKVADLVLLDADPLIDIRNTTRIRGVLIRGRYLDRRVLDSLLAGAARAANH
jgi:imidazolonepropionase-like amidohydrolase